MGKVLNLSIRAKMTIYVVVTVGSMLTLMVGGLYFAYLDRIEGIEDAQAQERLERVVAQLANSQDDLAATAADWAWWTESFEFVTDENQEYVDANLYRDAFTNLNVDSVAYLNNKGSAVYNSWFQNEADTRLPVHILVSLTQGKGQDQLAEPTGLAKDTVVVDGKVLLLTARNILMSDETGDPPGVLIMGREIDEAFISNLSELTSLNVTLSRCGEFNCGLASGESLIEKTDSDYAITGVVAGLDGLPVLEVKVTESRVVYQESTQAILRVLAILALLGVVAVGVTVISLRRLIVRPLEELGATVGEVARASDLSLRAPVNRSDEIGSLGDAVNVMLSRLQSVQDELTAAKDQVEGASAAKSKFLAHVSHELRTPINGVLAYAQLLEFECPDGEANEFVGQIITSARHITKLVDEFLDIARIESGSIPIDIAEVRALSVVTEVADMAHPLAAERSVDLEVVGSSEVFAMADELRLRQVVLNLVSNAIKYGNDGTSVVLSVAGNADTTTIAVIDQGNGIPDAQLGRLFVPFDRLDADDSNQVGTGIGLSVTKQLVELMDGSIEVSSTLGVGTTFVVTLPAPTGGVGYGHNGADVGSGAPFEGSA